MPTEQQIERQHEDALLLARAIVKRQLERVELMKQVENIDIEIETIRITLDQRGGRIVCTPLGLFNRRRRCVLASNSF
jgi:hypothetical protein